MADYDSSYLPPAAVADVALAHPVTGASSGLLRGKLDTGADLTVIPHSVVLLLDLLPHGQLIARGYDGTFASRSVYYVRFAIEGQELSAVRCVAAERATVLVGRNVLNRFVLTLDGKNLRWNLL